MRKLLITYALALAALPALPQRYLPQTVFRQAEETDDGEGAQGGGASEDAPADEAPPDEPPDEYPGGGDGGDEYVEGDIGGFYNVNLPGDQFIRLNLGLTFPMNFPGVPGLFVSNATDPARAKLYIGGQGSIGYNYFLTESIAIGFDVAFGFNVSVEEKIFNYVPFMFVATYQPVVWRFEFPLTLGVGFAWHQYGGQNYFPALALKAEAAAMFRITESWSAGLGASYLVSPEFPWNEPNGIMKWGQFLTVSASARYHF